MLRIVLRRLLVLGISGVSRVGMTENAEGWGWEKSAASSTVNDSIRAIFGLAPLESRHQLAKRTVVRVVLQRRIGSSVLRLQSQKFVPCILPDQARLSNLCSMLIPERQGLLAFLQQHLIFFADPCFEILSIAHAHHLSLAVVHFARQQK